MKSGLLLPVIILLLVSCARLPVIDSASPTSVPEIKAACDSCFAEGKWRLVHGIEAVLPNGQRQFLIGVSLINTTRNTIDSVILTVEGLVLFDARYDRSGIVTRRAVPPFDSPHFSREMINDIELMFIKPESDIIETGTTKEDMPVCRYREGNGSVIDVTALPGHGWMITRYTSNSRLKRRVVAEPCRQPQDSHRSKFACHVELNAFGRAPYTLYLKLIEAEPVPEEPSY